MRLAIPATFLALAGTAALVTLPSALRAEESARDAVDRLMPQLLSEDDTQRADAEKTLFALGDAGRTELERITRENDPRRAIAALRLLQSPKWDKAAIKEGEQRVQREDGGTDRGAGTDLDARLQEMRARFEQQMQELRRRMESFDGDFTLRMPKFEFGPGKAGGSSSGTIVENDRTLAWTIEPDGRVKVTAKDGNDAPERKYEAPNMAALKKEHPEIAERLEKATGQDWTINWTRDVAPRLRDLRLSLRDGETRVQPDDQAAPPALILGITWAAVPDVLRDQLELGDGGMVIEQVVNHSLAERLGLARNDVLLEVQGKRVANSSDIRAALKDAKEGEKLTALVVRKGKKQALEATK
jgi:hypothetical protein